MHNRAHPKMFKMLHNEQGLANTPVRGYGKGTENACILCIIIQTKHIFKESAYICIKIISFLSAKVPSLARQRSKKDETDLASHRKQCFVEICVILLMRD